MSLIIEARVEMDDHGGYVLTVVDHLTDTTETGTIPEQFVGMLPLIMSEARKKLGNG
jgi:hypothetical protein